MLQLDISPMNYFTTNLFLNAKLRLDAVGLLQSQSCVQLTTPQRRGLEHHSGCSQKTDKHRFVLRPGTSHIWKLCGREKKRRLYLETFNGGFDASSKTHIRRKVLSGVEYYLVYVIGLYSCQGKTSR